MHTTLDLRDFTDTVLTEIVNDDHNEWFLPVLTDVKEKIFERCRMKFINGNLDYTFHNALVHAQHNTRYNPGFVNTLSLCNKIRDLSASTGPFGRMCIWKVPPGMHIEAHVDNYTYHQHVTRWLYFVNLDSTETLGFINGAAICTDAGYAINFNPSTERHSFKNNSSVDWYFLGFDIWDSVKLAQYPPVEIKPISYYSSH